MNVGTVLRMAGYFIGFVVTDIAVGLWEESKMRREMKEYQNASGGTIMAHEVTEETVGTVITVGGGSRDVTAGDVLVATDRPDVYEVPVTLDGYEQTGAYDAEDSADDSADDSEGDSME